MKSKKLKQCDDHASWIKTFNDLHKILQIISIKDMNMYEYNMAHLTYNTGLRVARDKSKANVLHIMHVLPDDITILHGLTIVFNDDGTVLLRQYYYPENEVIMPLDKDINDAVIELEQIHKFTDHSVEALRETTVEACVISKEQLDFKDAANEQKLFICINPMNVDIDYVIRAALIRGPVCIRQDRDTNQLVVIDPIDNSVIYQPQRSVDIMTYDYCGTNIAVVSSLYYNTLEFAEFNISEMLK